jgi:uncharacterized OsmC-like protein
MSIPSSDAIRDVLERNARAVSLKPAVGQGTSRTQVRLQPGLACTVEEGEWTLTVGMSHKSGGSNAGPNPGVLGRGALGSCLTIGYAMWAARLRVPLRSLEVTVEADYDRRGELGVDDTVPPGYLQVRYIVTVDSPAPEADVVALIDTADKYSSYLDVYRRAHDVRRELHVTRRS